MTHSGLKMSKKCKQIILKVRICVGQYPTQLTVTLQNCRKIWSSIFVTFLVFFALFFANSFTVMVALVAKPLVLPSQWTLLQKIVQKTLEMWLKLLQTFLQFSNVTVSCVKYHFDKYFLLVCTKKNHSLAVGTKLVDCCKTKPKQALFNQQQ